MRKDGGFILVGLAEDTALTNLDSKCRTSSYDLFMWSQICSEAEQGEHSRPVVLHFLKML